MYAVFALLGWIWFYCTLPETKGLSLEAIERLFEDGPSDNGYDTLDSQVEDDNDEETEVERESFSDEK